LHNTSQTHKTNEVSSLSGKRKRERVQKYADPEPKTAAIRRDSTSVVISSHQANKSHELLKALAQYSQHHLAAEKTKHVDSGLQGNGLMNQGTPERLGGETRSRRRFAAVLEAARSNKSPMVAALLVGGGGRRLCSGHSGRVKGWLNACVLMESWAKSGYQRWACIAMGSRGEKGRVHGA